MQMNEVKTRDMCELRLAMFTRMLIDHGYPPEIASYLAREITSGRMSLNQRLGLALMMQ